MLRLFLFTFGVNVQGCSETERTNGDVSRDPQRSGCEDFEGLLGLFAGHYFVQVGGRGRGLRNGSPGFQGLVRNAQRPLYHRLVDHHVVRSVHLATSPGIAISGGHSVILVRLLLLATRSKSHTYTPARFPCPLLLAGGLVTPRCAVWPHPHLFHPNSRPCSMNLAAVSGNSTLPGLLRCSP